MSAAGRQEALDRWSRNREIGDLETELERWEEGPDTPERQRRLRTLKATIARLHAAERDRP